MERRRIDLDKNEFPGFVRPLLDGALVYDSSCSPVARVWFLDRDGGYYLKCAPKGTLQREAELTHFFHERGMAARVLAYESLERDWLLTERVSGEDCICPVYLNDPKRLCDTTAQLLRWLHGQNSSGCPVANRTAEYLETAARNHRTGAYDLRLFSEKWSYRSPKTAWQVVEERGRELKADTLIHGDYCLPNIVLNNWNFSGFVDLDTGGVGDRHVDLFWGIWSLKFNLKTDAYEKRFLDVYGRENVDESLFPVIAAIEVFG